ncbi:MAG: GNAT family N-acetyltransferase, partial [Eubacteriales bacterium]
MNRLRKIFSRIPELETQRLILRRMRPSDADDMYEYSRDPEVTRYLLWSPHPSRDYTKRYLEQLQSEYRLGEFYDWA